MSYSIFVTAVCMLYNFVNNKLVIIWSYPFHVQGKTTLLKTSNVQQNGSTRFYLCVRSNYWSEEIYYAVSHFGSPY